MAQWTLAEIQKKVRQVSGRYSLQELSNDQLVEYINKYFQYTFPAELKLERNHTFYEFLTVANQQSYTLPDGYVNFEPPASIDRLSLLWYQEPSSFYENNPENIVRLNPWASPASATISGFTNANPGVISVSTTSGFGVGDAISVTGISESGGGNSLNGTYTIASTIANTITTGTDTLLYAVYIGGGVVTQQILSYSTTLTGTPIQIGSVIVDDTVEVFTDNEDGTLTGDQGGTGTINYTTGLLTVNFNTSPTANNLIQVSYISMRIGLPTAVLLYNNLFTFFPVPERAYRFRTKAYADTLVTTAAGTNAALFVNATDRPLLDQWGPCIAYGAARDIHADYGEMGAYQEVTALYKEQLAYVLRRTNQNLLNTRAQPHF